VVILGDFLSPALERRPWVGAPHGRGKRTAFAPGHHGSRFWASVAGTLILKPYRRAKAHNLPLSIILKKKKNQRFYNIKVNNLLY
jgi:hypothetical protein